MKNNFTENITSDKYQIFLLICPAMIPVNFAAHSWFVCIKDNQISRWEVRHYKNKEHKTHIHLNELPPFFGIEKFPLIKNNILWGAKLLKHIGGDENSLAQKIFDFIDNSPKNYKFLNEYFLLGPNSNTYVQWILDNFPEFNIKLPFNCFGKNYKIK